MSRFPRPCVNAFDDMSIADPHRLSEWIRSDELSPAHISFAAEALGGVDNVSPFVDVLISLLFHPYSIIRKGAVYGLTRQLSEDDYVVSWLTIVSGTDASPVVRMIVRDVLMLARVP
jgi:hypothetical protein